MRRPFDFAQGRPFDLAQGRAIVFAIAIGACAGSAESTQRTENKESFDVRARSSVSQTAVWVGDTVDFVVEFQFPPQVDVIAEDLAGDKLPLEGLQVVESSREPEPSSSSGTADVATRRFRYRLATYDTAAPVLRIAAWPVRYYVRRAGERPEDVSPAGEVQVPGVTIARRSTLPDAVASLDLRTSAVLADAPELLRAARPLGVGLMALAAVPLAVWAAALIARRRSRPSRPPARAARAHARSALEGVRAIDIETDAGRRDAYGRLERAVRQHLADTRGIPAHALSAPEVAARLRAAGSPQADAAGELLAECERARYAPPDRLPPAARFSDVLGAAERMFEGAPS